MQCAIQTPTHIVELEEHELRRLISLADYGIQQKKLLRLPMNKVEQRLEALISTELRF